MTPCAPPCWGWRNRHITVGSLYVNVTGMLDTKVIGGNCYSTQSYEVSGMPGGPSRMESATRQNKGWRADIHLIQATQGTNLR